MSKSILLNFSCAAALLLSACYSNTKITGSWKDTSSGKVYGNVFVAALSANPVARSTVESAITSALIKKGVQGSGSMDAFPPGLSGRSITKDTLLEVVRSKNADAIMTVSMLKKETESRYVSGGYAPASHYGYYGSFGGYYNHWSPYAYNPGYYEQHEVYYLETNLYDSATEKLVWSGQSRTYNYDDLKSLSQEYAYLVVERMKLDKVLK